MAPTGIEPKLALENSAKPKLSLHVGALGVLALVLSSACTGVISGSGNGIGPDAAVTDPSANPATGGSAGTTGSAGAMHNTAGSSENLGSPPSAAPLSRLTSLQYENTLRDLFAPLLVPDQHPPTGTSIDGFDNNVTAQTPSPALIEAYHASAIEVTAAALAQASDLLGCTPATRAEEDSCATEFLSKFGARAFRHPLDDQERADLTDFYTATRTSGADFRTTMSLAVEAILESPSFLYRVEVGAPIPGRAAVQLSSYEMASRLSYLLLNSMPDSDLFVAAEAGDLSTPEGIETQARRLLKDPRSHDAILNFYSQWLRFDKMDGMSKDTTLFPNFNGAVATGLQQSARKFVDGIFFGVGTLSALLTDNHAWVNDALAPIYGVKAPGTDELTLIEVDPAQRSGIVTDAGLMAGFAHDSADSPVLRGVFVLDRLMCSPPPPPPVNVNTTPPAANTGSPQTTRDRFATQHEQGACAGCHHNIDGLGFGFEHYDALGQWRTTDAGLPVDSSGWFPGGYDDLKGTFDGAVELGQLLASSKTVQTCVSSQWVRYALGLDRAAIDDAYIQPIVAQFVASGLNMRELIISLVKSDIYRTRVVAPE
jgi:Protein of unknown function (DUF1592)/Protein of unknown function (DUF1588)/Protein of unknown function (DUF1595)/Protein of unknown function (DUF1585)/Protein of unknown function (DUF1587)